MDEIKENELLVVGIGASAGGLKAMEELLLNLPNNTEMAFVVIQHLSPRFKSLMKEILTKDTKMKVIMAENDMELEANHVYLIPAGFVLTIIEQKIILEPQGNQEGPHFVIDKFFHSLGQEIGKNAIAVVLSGTGSDGSRGIQTVKRNGGLVLVQEPQSGEFDGMPLSAIDTQIVDFVLTPREIAEKLIHLSSIGRDSFMEEHSNSLLSEHGIDGKVVELNSILELVKKYHEVDFTQYKLKTIERRIERHMAANQVSSLNRYFSFLAESPLRIKELFFELLINVTEFFRDPEGYKALEEHVFPRLLGIRQRKKEIRIWICACATGEEVYSIAIAMHEYAVANNIHPHYSILATDVNEQSLAIASKGHYAPSKVSNIPEEILDKYFSFNGEKYEVKDFIRDNVIFARNDVTIDPPFINLDLVVCRNLLIYFQQQVQRRVLLNFHFGLNSGGYLWLGSSENILDFKQNFSVLNEKWKVFQAQGETPKSSKHYSVRTPGRPNRQFGPATGSPRSQDQFPSLRSPRFSFAKALIDRYVPPAALVDEEFNILYLAGGVGKYLSLPDMEINRDLLSMVSQPMVMVLRDGMRRLLLETKPIFYRKVQVMNRNEEVFCNIRMEKLHGHFDNTMYLVEWQEMEGGLGQNGNSPALEVDISNIESHSYEIIKDLQDELNLARQEVQNSMEELETSNEELQASNEELLASNEELQSTNEELQSVNEELYTVNSELQTRNKELTDANETIDNLMNSTNIGTLFLDNDLKIRFFSPPIKAILPLDQVDIGTRIDKFYIRWEYPDFLEDVKEVRQTGRILEKQIRGVTDSLYFLVRLFPYFQKDAPDGVIINLIDVSEQKKAEMELQVVANNQRRLLDAIPLIISIFDRDGNYLYLNRAEEGKTKEELLSSNLFELLDEENRARAKEGIRNAISSGNQQVYLTRVQNKDGGSLSHRNLVVPIKAVEGVINEVLVISINLSDESLKTEDLFSRFVIQDQLLESSNVISTIKDEHFRYIYTNNGFSKLFDTQKESILGSNDMALFPEEIALQLRRNDEWVLKEKKELFTVEKLLTNKGKRSATVLKFPILRDQNLVSIGTIAILNDFELPNEMETLEATQTKLEQLVDERTDALINANKELRAITRTMAHDLRGPLRAIHTFTEMLQIEYEENLGEEELDILEKVLRHSSSMGQIIDSLLSYVKVGSIKTRNERIDMRNLAGEIWDDLQYLREESDCHLVFRNCPPLVADLPLMKQVLTNLFSNALKYRKEDQPCEVEFGAYEESNTNAMVYFVRDNGQGFDPKESEKIFGVFERLYEAREKEGHGIGLSIVKKAIELQGGSIWAYSELGQGATFFFSIPLKSLS